MKTAFLLFVLLILTSCKQEEKIHLKENFVFTTTTKSERVLSLKFQNDTVFVAWDFPKHEMVYYFLLNEIEKDSINFFLSNLDYTKYKSEYYQQSLQDGGLNQFEFNSPFKRILVYGHDKLDEIKDLTAFSHYLIEMYFSRRKIGLRSVVYFEGQEVYKNKDIDFGNVDRFILPDIPYDSLK